MNYNMVLTWSILKLPAELPKRKKNAHGPVFITVDSVSLK